MGSPVLSLWDTIIEQYVMKIIFYLNRHSSVLFSKQTCLVALGRADLSKIETVRRNLYITDNNFYYNFQKKKVTGMSNLSHFCALFNFRF